MNLDTRRRGPGAVRKAGNEDTRARSAGEVESYTCSGEDGKTLGLGNNLGRDLDDSASRLALLLLVGCRGSFAALGLGLGRVGVDGLGIRSDAILYFMSASLIHMHHERRVGILQKLLRICAAL